MKSRSYVHFVIFFIALIPFSSTAFSIKSFALAELVIPLLFLITFINFMVGGGGNVSLFQNEKGNQIGLFLGLFIFVLVLNYIRYPLKPTSFVENASGSSVGGFKTYFRFMNDGLVFLMIVYWANRHKISSGTIVRMFSWVAMIIVFFGLFSRLTGYSIPGLDTHSWAGQVTAGFGEAAGAVRNPILEQFSQILFFLTLSGAALFQNKKLRFATAFFFLVGIYLGGGRIAVLTVIGGTMVFLFLRRKFIITGVMVLVVILGFASMKLIHELAPNAQIARLTNIGGLKESSVGRYYIYKYGLKAFAENPLFGTGYGQDMDIGLIKIDYKFEDPVFIEKQLRMGGHGTHVALLKNLGLVGYIPYLMMWVTPMLALLPYAIRRRPKETDELLHWRQSQFIIICFSALLVRMFLEGNGSELKYYVFVGLASVILNEILQAQRFKRQQLLK